MGGNRLCDPQVRPLQIIEVLSALLSSPWMGWGDATWIGCCRLKDPINKPSDLKTLQDFLAPRLAKYKIPTGLHVVDNIPKNAMGKINKKSVLKDLNIR